MNNKENINTGLDPEIAVYKLPMNYKGLTGKWADLDGYQIMDYKSFISIEEKAFWSKSKEEGAKFNNKWIVDHMNVPAICLFTSSGKDHVALGEKEVSLQDSYIVDFYVNDLARDFEYVIGKDGTAIPTRMIIGTSQIQKGLNLWYDFINKTGYWENDPRG